MSEEKIINELKSDEDPIVQYIAVRSDLGWDTGAIIAQSWYLTIYALRT